MLSRTIRVLHVQFDYGNKIHANIKSVAFVFPNMWFVFEIVLVMDPISISDVYILETQICSYFFLQSNNYCVAPDICLSYPEI